MGLKQKSLGIACAVGIAAGVSACSGERNSETRVTPSVHKSVGATAVSSTAEAVSATTTTKIVAEPPPTSTTIVELPRPLTLDEQQENAAIIDSTITNSIDTAVTPIVPPHNEELAEVTQPNEFLIAFEGCGAIIAVNNYISVESITATTVPAEAKKLDLVLYGDLGTIADGKSYTPDNYQQTYNTLRHADPGSAGNPFNPSDPASVQRAVDAIVRTVMDGCTTGVATNYP